jgi:hypothetical protein
MLGVSSTPFAQLVSPRSFAPVDNGHPAAMTPEHVRCRDPDQAATDDESLHLVLRDKAKFINGYA